MKRETKLTLVKIIHTLIWIGFNVIFGYMFYAVIVNKINQYVWIGIGLFLLEIVVLIVFKSQCPLTVLARRFSTSRKDNFDINLPVWLARYNKVIYSIGLLVFIFLLVYRLLNR